MDPFVILATFAVIFPAELPDKSMFAGVAMGSRFKPIAVWTGLALAFLTHVVIAVTAGHAVSFLPDMVTNIVVTAFFAGGALYLLTAKEREPAVTEQEPLDEAVASSFIRTALMSYGIVFISEWGDLTQLATVNMAARYEDPVSVAIGAIAALWTVSALGVWLGRRLVKKIPMHVARRGAGTMLALLAIWSLIDLVRSID